MSKKTGGEGGGQGHFDKTNIWRKKITGRLPLVWLRYGASIYLHYVYSPLCLVWLASLIVVWIWWRGCIEGEFTYPRSSVKISNWLCVWLVWGEVFFLAGKCSWLVWHGLPGYSNAFEGVRGKIFHCALAGNKLYMSHYETRSVENPNFKGYATPPFQQIDFRIR